MVHAVSRCVRRAWLCGIDPYTGQDYKDRLVWIREWVRELAGVFAVEVCAYAIMNDHSHFVLWSRPSVAAGWSGQEVARRWLRVFGKREADEIEAESRKLGRGKGEEISLWRERLGSVSWFMRIVNERIARRANAEDGCSGRFWEGRFQSQLIEDAGVVLACMAHVDLKAWRAKQAKSLETSVSTSIHERAKSAKLREAGAKGNGARAKERPGAWLSPLAEGRGGSTRRSVLSLDEETYVGLVDWTGRTLAKEKRGPVPPDWRPILEGFDLEPEQWLDTVDRYGELFHRVAGKVESIQRKAESMGQRWMAGVRASRKVFRGRE